MKVAIEVQSICLRFYNHKRNDSLSANVAQVPKSKKHNK